MNIHSIYPALKWEFTKAIRSIQAQLDSFLWKPRKNIDINKYLEAYGNKESFFFIQVGANDGVTGDKLHIYVERYKWKGILVEPVPYIFERLKNNYKSNTNLIFENSAISNIKGFLPFYSIAEKNDQGLKHNEILKGFGLDQLGSFDKKTILKHSEMLPDFESFIKEIKVPALSLNDLFIKHTVKELSLLQIDTEGYDYEILKAVNFESLKPQILIFEHQHIQRKEYKTLISKFKSYYSFFINGWDTICIIKNLKPTISPVT